MTSSDSSSKKGEARANTAAAFFEQQLARGAKPNRLAGEKSPYLLQHAFNPVDWLPWGNEAFVRAREEDKPILLSIGYSTCHWCHVMARESFEDPALAGLINRYFVPVKVDREERPDIDQIYMTATQAMTGGGGWPLTVFIDPDGKPFYAGTYFPPRPRHGLPSFSELLVTIHQTWQHNRAKVRELADRIADHLRLVSGSSGKGRFALERDILDHAFEVVAASYDAEYGGFGKAPKFPRPVVFNFLLRYWKSSGRPVAREMVFETLRAMAAGGIHDHVGGGFHRYSVDRHWHLPHFEKMLYDQAQLAVSYLEAYQISGDRFFAGVARRTLDYVIRDFTDPNGGFYSAKDADSPRPDAPATSAEGAFYLWTAEEIEAVLGQDAPLFMDHYGVKRGGNVEGDPQGEFARANVLHETRQVSETAQAHDLTGNEVECLLADCRRRLFTARLDRPRPQLDDKVITSWNGLMISAFARAYQVLGTPRYLQAALRAADFAWETLYDHRRQVLLRRYRDGAAGLVAHLDDYAFLVQGLIDLYETVFDPVWLMRAIELCQRQLALFYDEEDGGFFDTAGEDGSILVRMKSAYDGAEPCGNSIAAMNLLRLARITGDSDWESKAAETLSAFADRLREEPMVVPQMLAALDALLTVPRQIVIAGAPQGEDTRAMLREVHRRFLPNRVLLLADGGANQAALAELLPEIGGMERQNGKATAHVCRDFVCQLPLTDPQAFGWLLDEGSSGG